MADLALISGQTPGVIRPSNTADPLQRTLPAAVDLTAGTVVKLNASGQWAKASNADAPADCWLVWDKASAGKPVTGYKSTMFDSFDVSGLAIGAKVGLSANAGKISDAPAAGKACGIVVPANGYALAGSVDKVLMWNSAGMAV